MTKPWKDYRDVIVSLYIQEGRTLQEVMSIMHQKHGFQASTRSYRQHFDIWGVGKYNCKRRQDRHEFPQSIDLPSPPGTPPSPMSAAGSTSPDATPGLHAAVPRQGLSYPPQAQGNGTPSETSSGAVGDNAARPDLAYSFAVAVKQEPLQSFDLGSVTPPYRGGAPHHFVKDQIPAAHGHQSQDRRPLDMDCWSPGDRGLTDWTQRAYFPSRKGIMVDMPRYSNQNSTFNVNTGQMSPTCLDQQRDPIFDMDWNMSKARLPPQFASMSPGVPQQQDSRLHEPKPMHRPAFHALQAPFVQDIVHTSAVPQPPAANNVSPELREKHQCCDHDATPEGRQKRPRADEIALELQNKRACADRSAGHRAANVQMEFA